MEAQRGQGQGHYPQSEGGTSLPNLGGQSTNAVSRMGGGGACSYPDPSDVVPAEPVD